LMNLYLHLHLAAQPRIEIAQGLVYGVPRRAPKQRDALLWLRQRTHGCEK